MFMAAKKPSKTARASVMAGAGKGANGFIRSSDAPLTVPTGAGEYVYVFTIDGKTLHLKTRSDEFVAEMAKFVSGGFEERITRELTEHAGRFDSFASAVEKINSPLQDAQNPTE
jgi:hypothetical protein